VPIEIPSTVEQTLIKALDRFLSEAARNEVLKQQGGFR
jgi:hypothetical protein